jgi:hypothetical protein
MKKQMKNIKLILTILIINFNLTLNAQNDSLVEKNFENKTFKTNQIIGVKDLNYNPTIHFIELYNANDVYGDITTFKNGKFTSGNIGECGNECRITASGNYSFKGNKICLFLEEISFWKECSNEPKKIINKEIGTFRWEIDDKGTIKLTSEN